MDKTNLTVPQKLRHYREACALSQQQVADALKIERSTYGKYETAITEPSLNTLVKLAKIFNVSPLELLPEYGDELHALQQFRDSVRADDTIYQLSKDERSLIAVYRVLSKQQKRKARELVSNLSKNEADNTVK